MTTPSTAARREKTDPASTPAKRDHRAARSTRDLRGEKGETCSFARAGAEASAVCLLSALRRKASDRAEKKSARRPPSSAAPDASSRRSPPARETPTRAPSRQSCRAETSQA